MRVGSRSYLVAVGGVGKAKTLRNANGDVHGVDVGDEVVKSQCRDLRLVSVVPCGTTNGSKIETRSPTIILFAG